MRLLSRSSASTLLGLALCVWPARGRADDDTRVIVSAAPHALGRVLTAGLAPIGPTLLASAGYGYTEAVLGMGDAHHRIAGALTLDERPLPWLAFALRLDGRYDAHVIPGQPTDTESLTAPDSEHVYVHSVKVDAALAALDRYTMRGGPVVIGLQWLALNRQRIPALLR